LNKIDVEEPEKVQEMAAHFVGLGFPVINVSGLTGAGIQQLKDLLEEKLEELRQLDRKEQEDDLSATEGETFL
jgi:50S ribosomal subunit-associated GTPase HflX